MKKYDSKIILIISKFDHLDKSENQNEVK